MKIKSIKEAKNLAGKVVLLRADLNVPLIKKGKSLVVAEDYKLIASLPTLRFLLKHQARVLVVSHWGDPVVSRSGQVSKRAQYSLRPVAKRLAKLLRQPLVFSSQTVGESLKKKIANLENGQAMVLENLRFLPGEIKNSSCLAKQLASLAQVYVNDAFAVSHRNHTSVVAIKKYLPAYAGLLLEQEVASLHKISAPRQPLVVVMGGAKIETKLALIKKLSRQTNYFLMGGALANNFLAAQKKPIGKSLVTKTGVKIAKKLLNNKELSKKIILPVDVVVGQTGVKQPQAHLRLVEKVKPKEKILDIGPQTMTLFARHIRQAQTIIWNGPMGLFEVKPFHHGTVFVGRSVASRAKGPAFGLVGGGETIQALRLTKMVDDIDWVSTGGGAILTYLGGQSMPGLKKIVK